MPYTEEEPLLTEAELIELYRRHTNMLYGYVSRRVGAERALAEDIVQETWLRAVNSWRSKGTPDQPGAWLVRVARNLLVSHFRRRRPHTVDHTELEIADDRVDPETLSSAALVNWGLSRMKRKQAHLIEAFHFEGRSIRVLALENGLSERAVEGRLRRARENLREFLEPHVRSGTRLATETEPAVAPLRVLEHSEGGEENARQART
jgi:RNA polymerase sigma-70 factor (ECF subfamily)